jgi:hypothetical protein
MEIIETNFCRRKMREGREKSFLYDESSTLARGVRHNNNKLLAAALRVGHMQLKEPSVPSRLLLLLFTSIFVAHQQFSSSLSSQPA